MMLETLRVFVTVSEQRNFSRAAELLNLSQPGVSQHIRNLEQDFGAKLLHRSPKQVMMTEAGELLYKRAKRMLALYEEARQEISLLHEQVTGSIRIGASFTIGEYVLPRLLAEFAGQYPQVEMQVTIGNTEEIAQSVKSHALDLGLVEGQVADPALTITPYMQDEMILVAAAGHPLAELRSVESELLQDEVWVQRESGSGTRAFSDQFIAACGLTIKRSYVFNSSQGVKEAVAAGLGIALLSRWVVRKELERGEICNISVGGARLARDFLFIRSKDHSATMAANIFAQKLLAAAHSS